MYLLLEVLNDGYKVYDTIQKCNTVVPKTLKSISGVVPLTEESVLAQCFTKLQLDIMKCIKDIKKYKIRYDFGAYPDLTYEVSTRRSIPDIIADSFIRPDDNFSLKDNKMCIVGRTFETFRYDYIIEDRQKFDKAVTKYCIMRNK